MIHIYLAFHLVILIAGAAAASCAHQVRRSSQYDFLDFYMLFIVLWNLMVLLQLFHGYASVGLYPTQRAASWPPFVLSLEGSLRCLIIFGTVWSFIKILYGLEGKLFSRLMKILFGSLLVGLSFILGTGVAVFIINDDIELVDFG